MPTPSKESGGVASPRRPLRGISSSPPASVAGEQPNEWTARLARPKRSVFGNYRPDNPHANPVLPSQPKPIPATSSPGSLHLNPSRQTLQDAIDTALARSFIYRFLAQSFEHPTEPGWARMTDPGCCQSLDAAIRTLTATAPALSEPGASFVAHLKFEEFESFHASYLVAFGHAARGSCPLNEIEYGDLKADPLFQPHRLADLAAFYRAFGLELTADAGERHDHIALELEFLCVLAAKEAYALEHQMDLNDLALCRDAQKRFLREHLGRWTPAFARRLARASDGSLLGALAQFTRVFIESDCARYGVAPGCEDLLLRPVDAAAELLCQSCTLNSLPPGAVPSP